MLSRTASNTSEAINIINARIAQGGKYHISLALEMVAEFDLYSQYEVNVNAYYWNDKIKKRDNYNRCTIFPEQEGVYLLGDTAFNPHTNEQFYYLKVGRGINLKTRIAQYKTYSPTTWHIDTFSTTNSVETEKKCHQILSMLGKKVNGTEWFEVSRKHYLEICKQGFQWFFHIKIFGEWN